MTAKYMLSTEKAEISMKAFCVINQNEVASLFKTQLAFNKLQPAKHSSVFKVISYNRTADQREVMDDDTYLSSTAGTISSFS